MNNIKNKLNAGFFFLSLGVLISLIASVTSFLNLAFEILNKKFPDILNAVYTYGYNSYQFDAARSALATLIIVFPVFLIITYFWKKVFKNNAGEHDIILKKWLIYIILFLSCSIVLVDLIVLVRYFVSGEITMRFIWKVIVAAFVAKMVLYYFLPEIWETKWKKSMRIISVYLTILATIALIIWSFVVMGSPLKQRDLRIDDKRVQDLQNIQSQVINYWQQKEKIPETINDLKDPISYATLPVDPEFEKGRVYEYVKVDKMKFQLCATFSLPIPKGWQESQGYRGGVIPMVAPTMDVATSNVTYPYPGLSGVNDSWDHQAGRTCFDRTIDKDLYPPYPKVLKN